MHRAKCLCVEKPLKDLRTALAQRIVQALIRSRAETVQRNTKSRNANLRHICVRSASDIYAIVPTGGSGYRRFLGATRGMLDGHPSRNLDPLRIDPMILFREKRRDHRAEIFRETRPA